MAPAARAHARLHARELEARHAEPLGRAHQDAARGRRDAVAGERRAQLQLDERGQKVVAQAAGLAQLLHAEIRHRRTADLPVRKQSMAAAISAGPSRSSCISRRAASISASETRPSDLATWPMSSNVVRKNTSETDALARPRAGARATPKHTALIEHLPDDGPDHRAPDGSRRSGSPPTRRKKFLSTPFDLSDPPRHNRRPSNPQW